jgi:hypothetical protein
MGAQTGRQVPLMFTQLFDTVFHPALVFIYPQAESLSLDTTRQVPSTFMYVAMA